MGTFMVNHFRLTSFKCPRCGRRFFYSFAAIVIPLRDVASTADFRKWAKNDSPEEDS